MMLQYLHSKDKMPMREFKNNVNGGFAHNLTESVYALLGIDGFEAEIDRGFDRSPHNVERQPLN